MGERMNTAIEDLRAWNPSQSSAQQAKEIWNTLHELHRVAIRNGHELEPLFPLWALDSLPHDKMELSLEMGYSEDLGHISSYGRSIPGKLEIPRWHLLLFFHGMSQRNMRELAALVKKRPNVGFRDLYHEIEQARSTRANESNAKVRYLPSDFKACC